MRAYDDAADFPVDISTYAHNPPPKSLGLVRLKEPGLVTSFLSTNCAPTIHDEIFVPTLRAVADDLQQLMRGDKWMKMRKDDGTKRSEKGSHAIWRQKRRNDNHASTAYTHDLLHDGHLDRPFWYSVRSEGTYSSTVLYSIVLF
ncbi:hypothetical protein N7481_012124 [Penicillium waksmanii]|uniref:uncharacterized protein n=1 Tax=Penicillium waksmanii TaxID=69791 RepID=UPI002547808C|nr:uncharacterized protein N7481_012124 [Penicillium waksmanii]KAJ5965410.1 hypothetical protein N7481_012124 [Penicillium waksmanii]